MQNKIKSFHHLALKSTNFDKSKEYYTKVLGLKEVKNWGEGDSRATMLELADGSNLELFAGGISYKKVESPLIHFAFNVDDVDAMVEKSREFGLMVSVEPKDIDVKGNPGFKARIAFCIGVDGEEIEFFTPKD